MRVIYTLVISLIFLPGCKGTKFSYYTDKDLLELDGQKTSVTIDDTYQLYMRQVLMVPNREGLQVPQSSPDRKDGPVIEKQYLLFSITHHSAIVINNIPSKYISFYNYPEDTLKMVTSEKEEIDIWFFNQFRFGMIGNNNSIFFPGVVSGKPQIWQFQEENGNLNMISLSECDNDGSDVFLIDPAYAIPLLFYKIPDFQLVFKDNSDIKLTDKREKAKAFNDSIYFLEDNSIHLIQNRDDWCTYFKLKNYPNAKRNIFFKHKRMYAAPFTGSLPCANSLPLINRK